MPGMNHYSSRPHNWLVMCLARLRCSAALQEAKGATLVTNTGVYTGTRQFRRRKRLHAINHAITTSLLARCRRQPRGRRTAPASARSGPIFVITCVELGIAQTRRERCCRLGASRFPPTLRAHTCLTVDPELPLQHREARQYCGAVWTWDIDQHVHSAGHGGLSPFELPYASSTWGCDLVHFPTQAIDKTKQPGLSSTALGVTARAWFLVRSGTATVREVSHLVPAFTTSPRRVFLRSWFASPGGCGRGGRTLIGTPHQEQSRSC